MRGPIPSRSVHRRRRLPGGAQHEADPAVVPVELGADQRAGAEPQLPEVVADLLEVVVVQLALQRGEQRPQPVGAELPGVVVGDLPQLPQPGHVGFQMADRAGQVGRRILVAAAVTSPQMPLVLQGADRDGVHLADDLGVGEAVGQDLLAVADGLRVMQAGRAAPSRTPRARNLSPAAIASSSVASSRSWIRSSWPAGSPAREVEVPVRGRGDGPSSARACSRELARR